ncbi:MAG: 4Fe-4S ferredoxin [Latescibacteria bacterium DG_63]|nr:MAG: 4Fe-4S ferredoxin [Latescibacteria bacterium DG_63]
MDEPSTAEKSRFWRKPLDADELQIPKGKVHIIKERCKGCGFCVEYCPRDVLEISEEFNSKGYHYPFTANPDACVSCGLCDLLCPEFAIYSELIEPEEVEKGGK